MNNTERTFAAIKAADKPISSHDLCNSTGLDYHQVGHALSRLREKRLLRVDRKADGLHGSCEYSLIRQSVTYGTTKGKPGPKDKGGSERKRKSRALAKARKVADPAEAPITYVPACWLTDIWQEQPRESRFEVHPDHFSTYQYKTLDTDRREGF